MLRAQGAATIFPQAIGMAATFDEPLMHQTAGVFSQFVIIRGATLTESRSIQLKRNGRDQVAGPAGCRALLYGCR